MLSDVIVTHTHTAVSRETLINGVLSRSFRLCSLWERITCQRAAEPKNITTHIAVLSLVVAAAAFVQLCLCVSICARIFNWFSSLLANVVVTAVLQLELVLFLLPAERAIWKGGWYERAAECVCVCVQVRRALSQAIWLVIDFVCMHMHVCFCVCLYECVCRF